MEVVAAAVALGLLAGVAAGFFGVGGGILFVPALLALGLTQLEAEATSLAAIIPTVLAGTWSQQRYGNVRWRHAAVIGVVAIVGVEVGVRVATGLSDDLLRRLFALLLFAVAAQVALRALRS